MIGAVRSRYLAMDEQQTKHLRAKNIRTALILATVALVFLLGMILRRMT